MASRILCTLAIPEPFTARLEAAAEIVTVGHIPTTDELCEIVAATPFDVLCPQLRDPITAAVLTAAGPQLRAVCGMAVGYNNIDVAAATARGVAVGNTPGVLTDATADFTLALILAAARRVVEGDRVMRRGDFHGWEPTYMLGLELNSATLGIIGFGRIGQAVARRARAFGMNVVYTQRSDATPPADLAGHVEAVTLDELLTRSDVISLHVPLTAETHHLINAERLRQMKPSAVVINTARGPVVDEDALVTALRAGVIGGAALDVYEAEPMMAAGISQLDNVVLAPHLGSATHHTRSEMARLCAVNTLAVLAGRLPDHCVNPEVASGAAWMTQTASPSTT